jgi:hypothetical protein
MATARVTANVAVQALFQVPLHKKAKIDAINIDNQSAGAITVQLEDDFTEDISNTTGAPTARSAFPFQVTIPATTSFSADENSVREIECLGNLGAICSAISAACAIIVNYHYED